MRQVTTAGAAILGNSLARGRFAAQARSRTEPAPKAGGVRFLDAQPQSKEPEKPQVQGPGCRSARVTAGRCCGEDASCTSIAMRTSCASERELVFSMTRARWSSTVRSLKRKSLGITLFECPAMSLESTSRSRVVSVWNRLKPYRLALELTESTLMRNARRDLADLGARRPPPDHLT